LNYFENALAQLQSRQQQQQQQGGGAQQLPEEQPQQFEGIDDNELAGTPELENVGGNGNEGEEVGKTRGEGIGIWPLALTFFPLFR
jgi:hypothetical protein